MPSSVTEMLAEANAAVPRLSPAEVRDTIGKENVLIVDVRDAPELAAGGKLKGAVNASRGMLEFRADPESPYYNPAFQKDKTVLVYCGSGGRAALSGKTLKDLAVGPSADIRPGVSRPLERPDFPEWDYTILAWVRSTYQGRPPIYSAATVARDPLPPMNSTPAIF